MSVGGALCSNDELYYSRVEVNIIIHAANSESPSKIVIYATDMYWRHNSYCYFKYIWDT